MFSEVTWAPIEQVLSACWVTIALCGWVKMPFTWANHEEPTRLLPVGSPDSFNSCSPFVYLWLSGESSFSTWDPSLTRHLQRPWVKFALQRIPMIPAHWTQSYLIYKDVLFNYLHVMLHFRRSTWERKVMRHCTSSSPLFSLSHFALSFLDFPSFSWFDCLSACSPPPSLLLSCPIFPICAAIHATLIQTRPVNASDNETSAAWHTTPKTMQNISVLTPRISLGISHARFLDMGREYFFFLMCCSLSPRNCIITLITVSFEKTVPHCQGNKGNTWLITLS